MPPACEGGSSGTPSPSQARAPARPVQAPAESAARPSLYQRRARFRLTFRLQDFEVGESGRAEWVGEALGIADDDEGQIVWVND